MPPRTSQRRPIEGKVAQVLNEYEIAFNVGRTRGVRSNDIADVVKRTKIIDPDSKQQIGDVAETLISTRISLVGEKFSVGRTYQGYGGGTNVFSLVATGRANRQTVTSIPGLPQVAFGPIYVPVGAEVVIQPGPAEDAPATPAKATPAKK